MSTKTKLAQKKNAQETELEKKIKMLKNSEEEEKELAKALQKYHVHVLEQEKHIKKLKEENEYIPQLSSKIKEFTMKLNKLSIELEEEKKKNRILMKEKGVLEQILNEIKEHYAGTNSPEHLKKEMEAHKDYINELESNKETLQDTIRELQVERNYYENETESTIMNLKYLMEFLETNFVDIESSDIEVIEPDIRPNNKVINSYFEEIKKLIRGIKAGINKSWKLLDKEYSETKRELIEIKTKEEAIRDELNHYKKLVKDKEYTINENKVAIENLKKKEAKYSKELCNELHSLILKYNVENDRNVINEYTKKDEKVVITESINIIERILSTLSNTLEKNNASFKTQTEALQTKLYEEQQINNKLQNNKQHV